VEFIETPVFTQQIRGLLAEDDYAIVQSVLRANPKIGKLIPGGGGVRKMRWRLPKAGRGKRGGIRIVYYCINSGSLLLLDAYAKNK
jgi:hypothetical protein